MESVDKLTGKKKRIADVMSTLRLSEFGSCVLTPKENSLNKHLQKGSLRKSASKSKDKHKKSYRVPEFVYISYFPPEVIKILDERRERAATLQGPSLKEKHFTVSEWQTVDRWSIGIITYLLLCGHFPFEEPHLARKIGEAKVTFAEELHISEKAQDFIVSLLQANPDKRMSIRRALQHPWLKSFEEAPPSIPIAPPLSTTLATPVRISVLANLSGLGQNALAVATERAQKRLAAYEKNCTRKGAKVRSTDVNKKTFIYV